MGASVEFAMQGMVKRGEGKVAMLLVVARRTVYLFLIGLFMGAQCKTCFHIGYVG